MFIIINNRYYSRKSIEIVHFYKLFKRRNFKLKTMNNDNDGAQSVGVLVNADDPYLIVGRAPFFVNSRGSKKASRDVENAVDDRRLAFLSSHFFHNQAIRDQIRIVELILNPLQHNS